MWAVLAPGPSASAEQAQRVHEAGIPLGAVGCAYQLAPFARFVASSDRAWWRNYPEAYKFPARYSMADVPDVERVRIDQLGGICNSGVLGLEVAKRLGAERIILLGFDMHGSHFFGQYTNGLRNTAPHQRAQHFQQFDQWRRMNRGIEVLNATDGSALDCFPRASLDDCLSQFAVHRAGAPSGV